VRSASTVKMEALVTGFVTASTAFRFRRLVGFYLGNAQKSGPRASDRGRSTGGSTTWRLPCASSLVLDSILPAVLAAVPSWIATSWPTANTLWIAAMPPAMRAVAKRRWRICRCERRAPRGAWPTSTRGSLPSSSTTTCPAATARRVRAPSEQRACRVMRRQHLPKHRNTFLQGLLVALGCGAEGLVFQNSSSLVIPAHRPREHPRLAAQPVADAAHGARRPAAPAARVAARREQPRISTPRKCAAAPCCPASSSAPPRPGCVPSAGSGRGRRPSRTCRRAARRCGRRSRRR
jgi:hypothetical protein